ncbi:hypothetical protein HDV05_007273, partial [Chytridiales sp. JEL 0842]
MITRTLLSTLPNLVNIIWTSSSLLSVILLASTLISLLSSTTTLVSAAALERRGCGTPELTQDEVAKINSDLLKLQRISPYSAFAAPSIAIYWHVVSRGSGLEGDIPQSQIEAQIGVLNRAYAGQFSFFLASVDRTTNADWFDNAASKNSQNSAMKARLRKGNKASLNIYTTSVKGLLGYSTFPWEVANALTDDGVVVRYNTLPGGVAPFNLGYTLVHEVGHWLGLLHTFQGGCDSVGDGIDDTPAQATSTTGCPTGKDTCPGLPGLDPIENYMDY